MQSPFLPTASFPVEPVVLLNCKGNACPMPPCGRKLNIREWRRNGN